MMKFKGDELYKVRPHRRVEFGHALMRWNENLIPTVDEVDEHNAFADRQAILQILNGQRISYGYDVERHFENEIHEISQDSLEKLHRTRSPAFQRKLRLLKKNEPKLTPQQRNFVRICMKCSGYTREKARQLALEML